MSFIKGSCSNVSLAHVLFLVNKSTFELTCSNRSHELQVKIRTNLQCQDEFELLEFSFLINITHAFGK